MRTSRTVLISSRRTSRRDFAKALKSLSNETRTSHRYASFRLSVADLQRLHRNLMPAMVANAGQLRREKIQITGSRYIPPDPSLVIPELERALTEWNDKAEGIHSRPRPEQIKLLARLHHQLLSIHPFSDGNGALARTLLSMQLTQLTDKSTSVIFADRDRYYRALQSADAGDLGPLEQLIGEGAT